VTKDLDLFQLQPVSRFTFHVSRFAESKARGKGDLLKGLDSSYTLPARVQ